MGETKTMTSDLKPEYGKETYWDERYKKFFTEDVDFDALLDGSLEEESPFFDWYRDWDQLGDKLKRYIEPGHSIMMLGCGNSAMSHEIYDGVPCHNILNVDVCDDVVENMKNLHSRVHGQSEMDGLKSSTTHCQVWTRVKVACTTSTS